MLDSRLPVISHRQDGRVSLMISTQPMPLSQQPQRSRVILAFALLYVLWGSTYLAMRVIVRDMPPYVAGAVRYLIAGPIMLAACALMGRKISLTRRDLGQLLVISILCSRPATLACFGAKNTSRAAWRL